MLTIDDDVSSSDADGFSSDGTSEPLSLSLSEPLVVGFPNKKLFSRLLSDDEDDDEDEDEMAFDTVAVAVAAVL